MVRLGKKKVVRIRCCVIILPTGLTSERRAIIVSDLYCEARSRACDGFVLMGYYVHQDRQILAVVYQIWCNRADYRWPGHVAGMIAPKNHACVTFCQVGCTEAGKVGILSQIWCDHTDYP